MYKEDLVLNNLQWLICHKTQPNQNKYIYANIHTYIYTYKGRSKGSKPHPERCAKAEHFCCGNTQLLLIKPEKTISDFCFNFCAGTNKSGTCVTNLKSG